MEKIRISCLFLYAKLSFVKKMTKYVKIILKNQRNVLE